MARAFFISARKASVGGKTSYDQGPSLWFDGIPGIRPGMITAFEGAHLLEALFH
jgi:hypothetical protein